MLLLVCLYECLEVILAPSVCLALTACYIWNNNLYVE